MNKNGVGMPTTNGDDGLGEPRATHFETKVITAKGKKKPVCMIWSHLSMYVKLYLALHIKILHFLIKRLKWIVYSRYYSLREKKEGVEKYKECNYNNKEEMTTSWTQREKNTTKLPKGSSVPWLLSAHTSKYS